MPVQFSPVVDAQRRPIPGFNKLMFVDLDALGVHGSPLAVLDDFHVAELPFSAHPHAGFSAATYVFEDSEGAVRSRTSTGADLVVGPGGIVWTQAGSGIIHEEIPARRGVELHGLQLFVNTTSEHKLNAPRVFALQGGEVPVWERQSDKARVVAGSYEGVSSPLPLDEPFTLLDVSLHTRLSYPLREGQNNVIYVLDGDLEVGGVTERRSLHRGQAVAVSGRGDTVVLEAPAFSHFLVLSGTAVDEPIVEEGPFIMNSRAQVEAAIARYRSGEMGALSPST
jgi:redox-sensitive bicupin YhaK (pirin superfamily)